MAVSTIGSIAILLNNTMEVPAGISGNMVIIVDMARQHVENYTGEVIGSNSISAKFQPAIIDFAKADALDLINAQESEDVSLAELRIGKSKEELSAKQYRIFGEMELKVLGRKVYIKRSLS